MGTSSMMTGALTARASSSLPTPPPAWRKTGRKNIQAVTGAGQIHRPRQRAASGGQQQLAPADIEQHGKPNRTDAAHKRLYKIPSHFIPPSASLGCKADGNGQSLEHGLAQSQKAGNGIAVDHVPQRGRQRNARNEQHDVADDDLIRVLAQAEAHHQHDGQCCQRAGQHTLQNTVEPQPLAKAQRAEQQHARNGRRRSVA